MRLIFLSLLFISTFNFSSSFAKQIWVGGGDGSYLTRCIHLSGSYITTGRYPSFIFAPTGHSGAIEDACRDMNSQAGINCLLRIRSQEVDAGDAPRFHWGSPGKGGRRHPELDPGAVRACGRTHTASEDRCVTTRGFCGHGEVLRLS